MASPLIRFYLFTVARPLQLGTDGIPVDSFLLVTVPRPFQLGTLASLFWSPSPDPFSWVPMASP